MTSSKLISRNVCFLFLLIGLVSGVIASSSLSNVESANTTLWSSEGQLLSSRSKRSLSSSLSWADRIFAPLRSLMGTRANDPWRYFMSMKRHDISEKRSSSSSKSGYYSTLIPTEFDARLRWPHCPTIGEIFEQGPCASCWAVAPTDVMSDRICIRSGGRHVVRLSAGNLLSCCRFCGKGCKGGFPGGAWMHWKKHGIVTGASYSSAYGCQSYQFIPCYQNKAYGWAKCPKADNARLKCKETCKASYKRSYNQDLYYGESVYRIPNDVRSIQLEILENGPVQANLRVYEDFLNYKSGVYQHLHGIGMEYHAVKILGWGKEKDGTPYWLAGNPWSKRWGNSGFFKILRGTNHAEIEAHIMAGIPKLAPEDVDNELFNRLN